VSVPVEVIPHVIVKRELKPNPEIEKVVKDKMVFLAVLEWHLGKSYDMLIKGFLEAFEGNDDVILILKVNDFVNPVTLKNRVIKFIKENKKSKYPNIIPICGAITKEDLYSLYYHCHAYINMSKREAFSLTTADAIIHGKIVISPDKGGQMYYLNNDIAVLVDSEYVPVSNTEKERSNYLGHKWIQPSYEDYVFKLRALYDEWRDPDDDQKEKLNKISNYIANILSPEVVIKKFEEHMDINYS
jgi:hypothetical protein